MTRSIYVLGGAGTGKSTFTAELLNGWEFGPFEVVHEAPLVRGKGRPAMIKVRGHRMVPRSATLPEVFYLGQMRESFPGTDGLDRVCGPAIDDWLRNQPLPDNIVAEGALLANAKTLPVLAEATDLLVLHLWCEEWLADLRGLQRGSAHTPAFVSATVTKSQRMADLTRDRGARVVEVDSGDPASWDEGIYAARAWLAGETEVSPD